MELGFLLFTFVSEKKLQIKKKKIKFFFFTWIQNFYQLIVCVSMNIFNQLEESGLFVGGNQTLLPRKDCVSEFFEIV